MTPEELDENVKKFTDELVARGLLIEAGWLGFKIAAIPKDASPKQIEDQRSCFFAGAQHLFSSIMTALNNGDPDEVGMEKLRKISTELSAFITIFKAKHGLK